MPNKNKTAADVVLEVSIDQYSKDKSFLSTRSHGAIVGKDNLPADTDVTEAIVMKVKELSHANDIDIVNIPVIVDGTGTSAVLKDTLKSKGLNIVQRTKSKKDKDYYGYSDDYYDYYYNPLTPWGVINFDDLEEAQAAEELNKDYLVLFAQYAEMGARIIDGNYYLEFGDERGKLSLMTELTQQFLNKLEKVTAARQGSVLKEHNINPVTEVEAVEVVENIVAENSPSDMVKEAELVVKSKGVILFKNAAGELIWAGIHSNKFQDRDKDILKEKSHKRFIKMVEDGSYPYPSLEIWHTGKAIGTTEWLAYDERGFLLSGGKVFKQFEELVTNLVKNTPEMGMSHGMPVETIVYDDEGYIDEYQSIEVTMLPASEASNILTSFTVERT